MNARRLAVLTIASLCALALNAASALAAREYHPGVPATFGSSGSEPGQLRSPSGIALNDSTALEPGTGDLYVLDRNNDRIERFNVEGEYEGRFDGSGEFEIQGKVEKGAAAPTGRLSIEEFSATILGNGIAVDNSGKTKLEDPSVGDVYAADVGHDVVDQFGPLGEYETQLTGICANPGTCPGEAIAFSKVYSVAVDPAGDLWVAYKGPTEGEAVHIAEFADTGSFVKAFDTGEGATYFHEALAVDSNYVYFSGGRGAIDKFDAQSGARLAEFDPEESGFGVFALAVNPTTDDLIAVNYPSGDSNEQGILEVFGPAGEPYSAALETFPFKSHKSLEEFIAERGITRENYAFSGIAIDRAGTVYTTGRKNASVKIYEDFSLPEMKAVSTKETAPTEDSAQVGGSFDPESNVVTQCQFEYVSRASFERARKTEAEAEESAKLAREQAAKAKELAGAAMARAKAFAAEGLTKRAVQEEAVAAREEEIAEIEKVSAKAEEASARQQQQGWGSASATECKPSAAAISKASNTVAVHAEPAGLQELTEYRLRLHVISGGKPRASNELLLFTARPPSIEGESATSVGSTEATVKASLDPAGEPTSYHLEYGTGSVEEHSTPDVDAGAATSPIEISAKLSGLQPEASYRFRFVASNQLGAASAGSMSFATLAAQSAPSSRESTCPNFTYTGFSPALPDCRAFELVSNTYDDTYVPSYGEANSEQNVTSEIVGELGTYRAAADGDAVGYQGGSSASGVGGNGATSDGTGNEYLAQRGAGGWEAANITPPFFGVGFKDFSADLSVQILEAVGAPTAEVESDPRELAECAAKAKEEAGGGLFSHDREGLHALVTMNQGSGECSGKPAGVSADDRHILFETSSPDTPQARPGTYEEYNLYDSVDGGVHQVNILPDGEPEASPSATFGAPHSFGDDISADGSRIFWTALEAGGGPPKALYVRENDTQPQSPVAGGACTVAADACTVLIAEEARFWAASSDGSKVFYTKGGDLYEFDLDTSKTTDLAEHGEVQGVIGASEDGSYVYFAADAVLAGANAEGRAPVAGQPNLYMSHLGDLTLVATLTSEDAVIHSVNAAEYGDWQREPGYRTAEVAAGGRVVAFMSRSQLTGYDNVLHYTEGANEPEEAVVPEVFVYSAEAGHIFCASCAPSGAAPTANTKALEEAAIEKGLVTSVATSANSAFMPRWVNEREGAQVYFMTYQPLVANDTNGLQDVYEWESEGSGGCQRAAGCIVMLSTAETLNEAYFVDASADGRDVFFTSRARLVSKASGETLKLYDARVGGGRLETSLACAGTGCQGAPPAPPIFATPASTTFAGVGNFEPAAKGAVKRKAKPKVKPKGKRRRTKCRPGSVKKRGRCVKRGAARAGGGKGR